MSVQTVISRRAHAAAVFVVVLVAVAAAQVQPAKRPDGVQGPLRGGYSEAGTLPARILEFKAEPATLKPGQSATLTWAVENPRSTTISPEVGRATPRGALKVTPKATTTYTLTVTGTNGTLTKTATVTVAGTVAAATAPTDPGAVDLTKQPAPKTADGKPDLTGVYGFGAGAPGGRGAAAPAPTPGSLPRTPTLKPGAEKYRVVRGADDTGLYSSCAPPGVPQTFMVPYYVQFVQSPKYLIILHEYLHLSRTIPLDGSPLPDDPDPFWMGHSTGKWEGDTLVVESRGFKESEVSGFKTTEALHLIERFKRPNLGTLEYEVVIEDPNVFAGPWLMTRTFPFLPEYNRVDEFFCENNRDYKPLFGK
jgi:hypothetical protein